ncbi:MAG: hypothetical protein QOH09_2113 [Pseudonocardiales bacterium]|jgi:hypothetical protein|nr:hypothetical protein [Pseudonocardiales bacterium]
MVFNGCDEWWIRDRSGRRAPQELTDQADTPGRGTSQERVR